MTNPHKILNILCILQYFAWAFANCFLNAYQISRQQHELVKSMKQSGKSIQSKSLNRVLGDLNNIHVQPYKVFVEEEEKKLHEHWLVRFSVPFFYAKLISLKTLRS